MRTKTSFNKIIITINFFLIMLNFFFIIQVFSYLITGACNYYFIILLFFSPAIRPICLPTNETISQRSSLGERAVVTGWGTTELGNLQMEFKRL